MNNYKGSEENIVNQYATKEMISISNGISQEYFIQNNDLPRMEYMSQSVDYLEQLEYQTIDKCEIPIQDLNIIYPSEMPLLQQKSVIIVWKQDEVSTKDQWSQDREFEFSSMDFGLLERLRNLEYAKYFQGRLRTRRSILGYDSTDQQTLCYQEQTIKTAVLIINEDLDQFAIQIFQLNHSFMQCNQTNELTSLGRQILVIMIDKPQGLIDEAYTQIIKQLTKCPKKHYVLRLYQLLGLFNFTFEASKPLTLAILNYLLVRFEQITDSDEIQSLKYLFPRFIRSLNLTSAHKIPPQIQILTLITQRQLSLQVYLCSGESFVIWVEYYEHSEQVKKKILEKLGIDLTVVNPLYYGLFTTKESEKMISDDESIWHLYIEYGDKYPQIVLQLLFKVVWVYSPHDSDKFSENLFLYQSLNDLMMGRIIPRNEDLNLIIDNLICDSDKFQGILKSMEHFPTNFFKTELLSKMKSSQLQNSCNSSELLRLIKNNPSYMSNNFQIKYGLGEKSPQNGHILSIKPFKVLISIQGDSFPIHEYALNQMIECKLRNQSTVTLSTTNGYIHVIKSRQASQIFVKIYMKYKHLLNSFNLLKDLIKNDQLKDYDYFVDYDALINQNQQLSEGELVEQYQQFNYEV